MDMQVYKYSGNNLNSKNENEPELQRLPLFNNIRVAESFFSKLTGLVFKKSIALNEGLLIEGCSSIHTFWMKFSIDAVFLDGHDCIVYLIENLVPYRFGPLIRNSLKVLELKSGAIKQKNIKIGDRLVFKKV